MTKHLNNMQKQLGGQGKSNEMKEDGEVSIGDNTLMNNLTNMDTLDQKMMTKNKDIKQLNQ